MITRIAKAIVRGLLALPLFIGAVALLPLILAAAVIVFVGENYRRLELWAVYHGDEAARDRAEWKR